MAKEAAQAFTELIDEKIIEINHTNVLTFFNDDEILRLSLATDVTWYKEIHWLSAVIERGDNSTASTKV